MKQIGPANGVLGKKITAKDASAAEDAKKLQSLFASTRGFWKARKANDWWYGLQPDGFPGEPPCCCWRPLPVCVAGGLARPRN